MKGLGEVAAHYAMFHPFSKLLGLVLSVAKLREFEAAPGQEDQDLSTR